jgi:hypothetical protein
VYLDVTGAPREDVMTDEDRGGRPSKGTSKDGRLGNSNAGPNKGSKKAVAAGKKTGKKK